MKLFFTVLLLGLCSVASAQGWPGKPIRVVVAFPPGGSTDIAVRTVSERIAQSIGQPIVVENRTGAAGNVGAEFVARQPADGYTVLASADQMASNPHLYRLAFDPLKDFTPVVRLARQPVVMAVHPSLNVNSIAELVALAKAKPGLGFATSGAGSQQHIVGEWFARLAGVRLTHVPYKGGGQAISDLVGGQVPLGSLGSSPVVPHYRGGRLKVLAQSTRTRSAALPDVPTYEEAGFEGLVLEQWLGFFVPAGSPAESIARLNAETNKALADAQVRERYAQAALDPAGGSAAEFAKIFRDDYERYARLTKELAIKID